jgi:hypothetical protein
MVIRDDIFEYFKCPCFYVNFVLVACFLYWICCALSLYVFTDKRLFPVRGVTK